MEVSLSPLENLRGELYCRANCSPNSVTVSLVDLAKSTNLSVEEVQQLLNFLRQRGEIYWLELGGENVTYTLMIPASDF